MRNRGKYMRNFPLRFFEKKTDIFTLLRPYTSTQIRKYHRKIYGRFCSKFSWFTQNIMGHNVAGNRNFWPILGSADKIHVIMLVTIILNQKTYFSILYVTGAEKVGKIITKIYEIWSKIANFAQLWRIFDILWPERGRSIFGCISEDICV
jgi:hypothetical protein